MNVKRVFRNLALLLAAVLLPWADKLVSPLFSQQNPVSIALAALPCCATNFVVTNSLGQPIQTNGQMLALSATATGLQYPIARMEFWDVYSNATTHVVSTNLVSRTNFPPVNPKNTEVF